MYVVCDPYGFSYLYSSRCSRRGIVRGMEWGRGRERWLNSNSTFKFVLSNPNMAQPSYPLTAHPTLQQLQPTSQRIDERPSYRVW